MVFTFFSHVFLALMPCDTLVSWRCVSGDVSIFSMACAEFTLMDHTVSNGNILLTIAVVSSYTF